MTKTNKKGTSLVELLAVIVIMGIIAAIAVPTVGALLKNTRKKAAGSDVSTIITSVQTYLSQSNENDLEELNNTTNGKANTYTAKTAGKSATLVIDKSNEMFVAEVFADDTKVINAITGTITLTLNDGLTGIDDVSFSDDFKYTKDSHDYSGASYNNGTVKFTTEA